MKRSARTVTALTAGVALVVAVTTGAVRADTWTVEPGGSFTATEVGDPEYGAHFIVEETGIELGCGPMSLAGTSASGTGLTNPLATVGAGDRAGDCVIPIWGRFDLIPQGSWQLNGVSYDASTGVTTGTLDNVTFDVSANYWECEATMTGHLDVTFTNGDSRLQLLPHHTLLIDYVDPVGACWGLIEEGQHSGVAGTFEVDPRLEISSP